MALWKKVFQGKEEGFPWLNVTKETRQMVTARALLEFTSRKVSEDNEILTEVQVEEEAGLWGDEKVEIWVETNNKEIAEERSKPWG